MKPKSPRKPKSNATETPRINITIDQLQQAELILRLRVFPNSGYSDKQIEWAVAVVRKSDANHSLLRYSERGALDLSSDN